MMDKSRTEQRMDKVVARVKRLQPDMMLVLRNQHAIMLAIRDIMSAVPADSRSYPALMYQIKQTDEAIGKNRAKDE